MHLISVFTPQSHSEPLRCSGFRFFLFTFRVIDNKRCMTPIELTSSQIIRKGKYPAPDVEGYNSLFFHPKTRGKGTEILYEYGQEITVICEENNIQYYYFYNDFDVKINVYPNEIIAAFVDYTLNDQAIPSDIFSNNKTILMESRNENFEENFELAEPIKTKENNIEFINIPGLFIGKKSEIKYIRYLNKDYFKIEFHKGESLQIYCPRGETQDCLREVAII